MPNFQQPLAINFLLNALLLSFSIHLIAVVDQSQAISNTRGIQNPRYRPAHFSPMISSSIWEQRLKRRKSQLPLIMFFAQSFVYWAVVPAASRIRISNHARNNRGDRPL